VFQAEFLILKMNRLASGVHGLCCVPCTRRNRPRWQWQRQNSPHAAGCSQRNCLCANPPRQCTTCVTCTDTTCCRGAGADGRTAVAVRAAKPDLETVTPGTKQRGDLKYLSPPPRRWRRTRGCGRTSSWGSYRASCGCNILDKLRCFDLLPRRWRRTRGCGCTSSCSAHRSLYNGML